MKKPMFNYRVTELLEKNISKIEEIKNETELLLKDIPDLQIAKMKHDARIKSVYYSMQMSGCRLSEEEVRKTIFDFKTRELNSRQRLVLQLFEQQEKVTTNEVASFLNINERAARLLCQKWVKDNFFVMVDESKKRENIFLRQNMKSLSYNNNR